MRTLTPRQRHFAELVAKGFSQSEAYRLAYRDVSPNARFKASRLITNGNIQAYIRQLRQPMVEDTLMTVQRKRMMLREIIEADVMSVLDDNGSFNMEAVNKLPPHVVEECAIEEKRHRDGSTTRAVRIRFADKLEALKLDNDLAGHGGGQTPSNEADDASLEPARAAAVARARAMIKRLHERKTMPTSIVVEHSS